MANTSPNANPLVMKVLAHADSVANENRRSEVEVLHILIGAIAQWHGLAQVLKAAGLSIECLGALSVLESTANEQRKVHDSAVLCQAIKEGLEQFDGDLASLLLNLASREDSELLEVLTRCSAGSISTRQRLEVAICSAGDPSEGLSPIVISSGPVTGYLRPSSELRSESGGQ